MKSIIKLICSLIVSILVSLPCAYAALKAENYSIFPQPSGDYSVGHQDYYWLNQSVCPDPFYNGNNSADFNADNPKFCREMMVRVYYPSLAPKLLATAYDPAMIQGMQQSLQQILPDMPGNILASLDQVNTWDTANAPLTPAMTFPVVIFSPGFGEDENTYVALIDELVSQGYIVVALNNTFISYSVSFPDAPIVSNISAKTTTTFMASQDDIKFVLQQLYSLHNSDDIFQAMNLDEIGVVGHSLGADMAMYLGHTQTSEVKAAVALDPYDASDLGVTLNYQFNIPFMVMHADTWFCNDTHAPIASNNADSYFIVITQMEHMNFSDWGLFPNQEAFSYALQNSTTFYNDLYSPSSNTLGQIDGEWALTIENAYILQFFNHYLKDAPLGWLQNPIRHFPSVGAYYIGPAQIDLPAEWPNAPCS